MSGLFAYAGWPLAACACAAVAVLQARFSRHLGLVADAGHELRGPLCAARLGLHGLADDRVAAAVDRELRRAAFALDDLAASSAGLRAGERPRLVDVAALLGEAADAWAPLARAYGAELCIEPPLGPALVHADPLRLAQACGNLVANAVEHGASPVRVRARVLGGCVRIEVQDSGPGLPGPVRVLARVPRRPTRRGRGLAIAAGIAERNGGRLAAAPSSAGARLVLELPRAGDAG